MAGLLGDVLPFVYSQADRLKRRVGGLLGDPLGTLTQAVNDANDRAGGLLGQTRAAAMEGLNYGPATQRLAGTLADSYNPAGITVWHGSPHKFSRFDSSKIGTGEGAQAYGHGLYLAESPSVAKSYADTLSTYHIATKDGVKGGGDFADALVANAGQYPASLSSAIRSQANKISTDLANGKPAEQIIASMRNGPYARMYGGLADAVEKLSPSKAGGSLYKVDLPDSAVARMLDWDKPLSQQAPEVQAALSAEAQKYINRGAKVPDAGMIVRGMQPVERFGGSSAVSEMLRQQGIPGIRYLDGGSRGAGAGTSNFVVFPGNESLLTILERNGLPVVP